MIRPVLLVILVSCSIAAFSQADEPEGKKDFTKIKTGMSEMQVRKIVGEPEIRERFKTLRAGTHDTSTYWRYDNDLTIIFRNHYVDRMEKNHAALLQLVQEWADPKNKDGIILLYK
jgi:hypothetical protein